MKKLPLLTAAAIATGAVLIAPEAQACEDCGDGGGYDICWSGSNSGFGACYVEEEFDECGEFVDTHCMVYYDAWCDRGSGGAWNGPWSYDFWFCYAFSWSDCDGGAFAE
jgi:hypothetical protein